MNIGMCYWRFKNDKEWRFGYCTHESGGLYRMGRWNGDTSGGVVVDCSEVEQRPYR